MDFSKLMPLVGMAGGAALAPLYRRSQHDPCHDGCRWYDGWCSRRPDGWHTASACRPTADWHDRATTTDCWSDRTATTATDDESAEATIRRRHVIDV